MTEENAVNTPIVNSVVDHLKSQTTELNAVRENTQNEDPALEYKRFKFQVNEQYTLFKLFLNAVMIGGFEEVSLNNNSIFHIEKIRETLNFLRTKGFSNVIYSTLEETLLNQLSFFNQTADKQHSMFAHHYYYQVHNELSPQQKSELKEQQNQKANTERTTEPAYILEQNFCLEDAALISFFKLVFELCSNIEIGLLGRTLRNYFKHRYLLGNLGDNIKMMSVEEMMNAPLYILLPKKDDIKAQIADWIKVIRQEQLNLCEIKSDESTEKLLEIKVDEKLDLAIKNVMNKLHLLEIQRQGISLAQIKQLIPNKEMQWTYFEGGIENTYNHYLLF